jgi:hypothetical protein
MNQENDSEHGVGKFNQFSANWLVSISNGSRLDLSPVLDPHTAKDAKDGKLGLTKSFPLALRSSKRAW